MSATKATGPATEAQLRLLRYLAEYAERNGYPPTIREMMAACGWASTNAPRQLLATLVRRGLVLRGGRVARALRITPAGWEAMRATP